MNAHQVEISIGQAVERFRQESALFDQRLRHADRWFTLQERLGYMATLLFPAILIIATTVLFMNERFPGQVTIWASATIFIDSIGLIAAVWKIILSEKTPSIDSPVTEQPTFGLATPPESTPES